jgi:hypothetical protein
MLRAMAGAAAARSTWQGQTGRASYGFGSLRRSRLMCSMAHPPAHPPATSKGWWAASIGYQVRDLHSDVVADYSEYPNMIFVDGENFTIRGQEFARDKGIELVKGPAWERDTFLWLPDLHGEYPRYSDHVWVVESHRGADIRAERAYYYTSVVGDERKLKRVRLAIRALGFEPNVFKKVKGVKSKGVDVSLATAVVSHAYRHSYDVAYLIAGDGDYVPMVEEAKRAGRKVVVVFFEKYGLSPDLRIAADHFIDVAKPFTTYWENDARRRGREAEKVQSAK